MKIDTSFSIPFFEDDMLNSLTCDQMAQTVEFGEERVPLKKTCRIETGQSKHFTVSWEVQWKPRMIFIQATYVKGNSSDEETQASFHA